MGQSTAALLKAWALLQTAAISLLFSVAGTLSAEPLYFTSFENGGNTLQGGPEWQKPTTHPWAQNSNDPMFFRTIGDNDPNLRNPVKTRTGNRSAYQHETFSQWAAMRDIGMDLYDNFYVKAWINFEQEKERLTNGQTACAAPTDLFIASGVVTAADDGGQPIPGWPVCRMSMPSISDSTSYFHYGPTTNPVAAIKMLNGTAAGKEWTLQKPTFYTCGGPPFGANPTWNFNQRLQVTPKAPNTLNPVAAGVKPGDAYEIRGSIAPLYRAIQIWLENRNMADFAKFGIWHRYGGDAQNAVGSQCEDTNNWKYWTRNGGGGVDNGYYGNPWVDTGIHRGGNYTGWHPLEIRVYGDNADSAKHQKIHFLVDDAIVGTADRYTAEGPVPFNRIQIGGLAVSQEPAFWDDLEIGILPEGGSVQTLSSVGELRNVPDGTFVKLPEAVINVKADGWFQVQGENWTSGVRCLLEVDIDQDSWQLRPGDKVIPTGKVVTLNGCEKVLIATNPYLLSRNNPVQAPVFADHRAIHITQPSLQGMQITTWGRVTDSGDFSNYFTFDDKSDLSNTTGVKVYGQGVFFIGDFVIVTGVLGCENGQPVIYTSTESGIRLDG